MTAVVEPNIDDSEYLAGKRNTAPEASFEDKQNMDFTKIHKHNEAEVAANVHKRPADSSNQFLARTQNPLRDTEGTTLCK